MKFKEKQLQREQIRKFLRKKAPMDKKIEYTC